MTDLEFFLMTLSIALFVSWVVGLVVWKSKEKDYQKQIDAWINNFHEVIEWRNENFREHLQQKNKEDLTPEERSAIYNAIVERKKEIESEKGRLRNKGAERVWIVLEAQKELKELENIEKHLDSGWNKLISDTKK